MGFLGLCTGHLQATLQINCAKESLGVAPSNGKALCGVWGVDWPRHSSYHNSLPNYYQPMKRDLNTFCYWCVKKGPRRAFFKVRDGPVDWHFCNVEHTEKWLNYRQKPATHKLCRMLPIERNVYLDGATMEQEISRLMENECDRNVQ